MTATKTAGAAIAVVLLLAGCHTASTNPQTLATTTATLTADSCHQRTENGQPLPDPTCTPGALNPAVNQGNIASTICKRGWTSTIRPPVSYTERLKRQGIAAYGYSDRRLGDYEEDHVASLELGGSPTDPRNLWPEPGATPNAKDQVEGALNRAVCTGRVTLAAAQRAIMLDWVTAEHVLGLK